ncbi:MAG: Rossmann fold nucleotide-binding protein, partial [Propionibacteriales bacterium]|nr:Rossmann fold nucleotide-binding protein [Propionibacteriales bacterium]
MRGWRIQGVDLTGRTDVVLRLRPAGAILLGSAMSDRAEQHLRGGGALLFPKIPELPFNPYRGSLYTPDELYAGLDASGYEATPDAQTYAWSREPNDDLARHLARALHDHGIDDALIERLSGRRVVGVMGGHELARDDSRYTDAALLGRELARRGHDVATGGGPGAMEAANLGAYLADAEDEALTSAVATLAAVPGFQ